MPGNGAGHERQGGRIAPPQANEPRQVSQGLRQRGGPQWACFSMEKGTYRHGEVDEQYAEAEANPGTGAATRKQHE